MAVHADQTTGSSSVLAVRRGLTSAAVVWQVLWLISQPTLWPQNQRTLAAVVALVGVVAAIVLLAGRQILDRSSPSLWIARINTGMLTVAVVTLGVTQVSMTTPDWHAVTELAALTAGIGGVLIGTRISIMLTVALAGLLSVAVIYPFAGIAHASVDGLIDPVYVLAVGLSAAAARRALLRSAAATDAAQESLADIDQRRRTAEAVESSLRATERMLHEQVLNTLVALARGRLSGLSRERLRERCADGARLLTSLTTWGGLPLSVGGSSGDLKQDLAPTAAELVHSGIEVQWDVDDLSELPASVREAVRTAAQEALSNVLRHARAHRVLVTARAERRWHALTVRIRISDDGIGIPDGTWEPGFGVQDAILRPMADIDGTAEVRRGSDGGVDVLLGWRSASHRSRARVTPIVQPSALATPVLAALGLYVAAQIVVTWPLVENTGIDVLAAVMWAVLALLVAVRTQKGPLTWPMVAAVGGAGWVVYLLQEAAFTDTDRGGWASPAIAALFLVVAATGPAWGWVLLTVVWLAFQGDPLHEITQPGTAMILVGAILGRSLRGNARRTRESRDQELDAVALECASRERIERFSHRFLALEHSRAVELLSAVAQGESDPAQSDVRNRAAREERYLRNITLTDPQIDGVHRFVSDLVVQAHERGVLLDVALAPDVVILQDIDDDLVQEFAQAMANAEPTRLVEGEPTGVTARITTLLEGEVLMIRMVLPLAPGVGGPPGVLVDHESNGVEMWLWQAALSCDATPVDGASDRVSEPVA